MIGYLWNFYIRCQEQGQQKAGFGGGGQNEHRYRLLQLMTFAGTGWQST